MIIVAGIVFIVILIMVISMFLAFAESVSDTIHISTDKYKLTLICIADHMNPYYKCTLRYKNEVVYTTTKLANKNTETILRECINEYKRIKEID